MSRILSTGRVRGVWTDTPREADTPPEADPPGSRHPREQYMLRDTGNKQAVRILLECILVFICSREQFCEMLHIYRPPLKHCQMSSGPRLFIFATLS